jgi:TRAP-type C4-dicarboxylate transport system permease small subunit
MLTDIDEPVVSPRARHLKWRALDWLEYLLVVLSGLLLLGFTLSEVGDVVLRQLGHPWLDAQEFSIGFFTWGVFLGGAVAVRRRQHFKLSAIAESAHGRWRVAIETFDHLVVIAVGLSLTYFGYLNYLNGFGSFLQPSETPVAVFDAAIPVCGVLITLFAVEQLVNGWRHGFAGPAEENDVAKLLDPGA